MYIHIYCIESQWRDHDIIQEAEQSFRSQIVKNMPLDFWRPLLRLLVYTK